MNNIEITITEKIAAFTSDSSIVCGNNDYTIRFHFDAEWNAYDAKTAHFVYYKNGVMQHQDVFFSGDTVAVPALHDVYEVAVGVTAGDLKTSTGARIPCRPCITDGAPAHDPPTPDVYNQLLEYLAGLQGGGTSIALRTTIGTDCAEIGIAEEEES